MKIVFIYENGFASNNGSNHLLCATIDKMLQRGHSVDLIEAVSVRDNADYPKELEQNGFRCHTVELKPIKKTNFIGRYLYGLRFVSKATKMARNMDADLFFVQSAPTVSFTIKKLKRCKKPIVYNIHDIFPGSAYELGILPSKFMDKVLKGIQRIGFDSADKIIVVSDDMRDKLLEEKVDSEKIEIVNTWFDSGTVHFVENDKNTFVQENEIDTSKLIIQYAGNVGQVFGVDEFATLVNSLKDNKYVEFHIVGSGVKLEMLKQKTLGANIRFFGWQPQNRMSEIYSYCDIEIISLHHGVIGNNVPSKMALAMACGKPIMNILEESSYYRLFNDNNIGWSFAQDELEKATKLIRDISKDKSVLGQYRDKVIEFTNSVYSKDKNTDLLLNILESVLVEKGE